MERAAPARRERRGASTTCSATVSRSTGSLLAGGDDERHEGHGRHGGRPYIGLRDRAHLARLRARTRAARPERQGSTPRRAGQLHRQRAGRLQRLPHRPDLPARRRSVPGRGGAGRSRALPRRRAPLRTVRLGQPHSRRRRAAGGPDAKGVPGADPHRPRSGRSRGGAAAGHAVAGLSAHARHRPERDLRVPAQHPLARGRSRPEPSGTVISPRLAVRGARRRAGDHAAARGSRSIGTIGGQSATRITPVASKPIRS